jgi:hypothetical protein
MGHNFGRGVGQPPHSVTALLLPASAQNCNIDTPPLLSSSSSSNSRVTRGESRTRGTRAAVAKLCVCRVERQKHRIIIYGIHGVDPAEKAKLLSRILSNVSPKCRKFTKKRSTISVHTFTNIRLRPPRNQTLLLCGVSQARREQSKV